MVSLGDYERVANSPTPVALVVHRVKDIVVPPGEVRFPARAARERNMRELSCTIATLPLPPTVDNEGGEPLTVEFPQYPFTVSECGRRDLIGDRNSLPSAHDPFVRATTNIYYGEMIPSEYRLFGQTYGN